MKATKVITKRNEKGCVLESVYLVDGKPIPEGKKYCPSCEQIKAKEDFTLKGNACRPCANKRAREHYAVRRTNDEWRQERRNKINTVNKQNKEKAIAFMGGKCFDCGGIFPSAVYDFHHLDMSTKEYNPSHILRNLEKGKEELEKCVLLCSNCHRIRHYHQEKV